ncbi:hypothetical protein MPD5_0049 [Melissococcus plutonius DAT561]|nr:hypothetical protein MPD5_0049 [Melissococcus plutonius DAT561]
MLGGGRMTELIYVHVDITSNAVLSKGITRLDFARSIVHHPQNILLLNPAAEEGEYDIYTGLKMIRGEEKVNRYLSKANNQKMKEEIKWIDFSDITMLKELTPLEISELLYFGHVKTSLHSPFFYKLQNNFVFFEFVDTMTRIYYRYIDEFFRILADKITHATLKRVNDRKTFFRRNTTIKKLNFDLLKDMKIVLQEGIIFCFSSMKISNDEYRIPIYLVEDAIWKTKNIRYQNDAIIATLVYDISKKDWHIEQDVNFES